MVGREGRTKAEPAAQVRERPPEALEHDAVDAADEVHLAHRQVHFLFRLESLYESRNGLKMPQMVVMNESSEWYVFWLAGERATDQLLPTFHPYTGASNTLAGT